MLLSRLFKRFSLLSTLSTLVLSGALAGCGGSSGSSGTTRVGPVANPCTRPAAGSLVSNPATLSSQNGVLAVNFSYQTTMDSEGRTLFCFMTPSGLENPTLQVKPGDRLKIKITNNTPSSPFVMKIDSPNCGNVNLTQSSLNLHFHGTNTAPQCHSDQVVKTLINSGNTFAYDLQIPSDEPPGLYWYHTHAHMLVESALQGGASGAIVIEGIENLQPAVAGLTQQVLVIRDQNVAGDPMPGGDVPSWDLTVDNVPISYPAEIPAIIHMEAGQQQLWRVSNSSSDSILDLQVQYDGVPQNLGIVALDGVPTGSQDGTGQGHIVNATDILIPTAGRAEFILSAPGANVTNASLLTLAVNTGPDGDNDPLRTLATIQTGSTGSAAAASSGIAKLATGGHPWKQRFENLKSATADTTREFFFSEDNPASQFFITEEGATPVLFDPNNPPAVVTTQGSVEDWTIQNQSLENHEFHIHQIHFLVLSQDNFERNGSTPLPYIEGQMLDTIQIPFWDGNSKHPFPSVTVRMDFRGSDIGDFVYHCHIAEHEDDGMMAIIRVTSSPMAAAWQRLRIGFESLTGLGESDTTALAIWCVRGQGAVRPLRRRRQQAQQTLALKNNAADSR